MDIIITLQVVKGIYRLDGDSLTYCLSAPGKPRPKRFEVQKGSGQTLVVLTRQKTEKANIRRSGADEIRVRSAGQNKTPDTAVKNAKPNWHSGCRLPSRRCLKSKPRTIRRDSDCLRHAQNGNGVFALR